jgi:hypothetical protein
MAGGLLNLISEGQQNIILNGNPSKTFFKTTYSKYTNFGLQKFRVDFEGSKTLRLNEDSVFTFKIPRYADLLVDCYLSVDLPNIWSSILELNGEEVPYEFKWITNLGAQMIRQITITCGNQKIQEYSGSYILACVQRDFTSEKKNLFDEMTGNTTELNNPSQFGTNQGYYPNAVYDTVKSEPSIRGRTLYIPLNSWFQLRSQMAFPMVSLQYNELFITITMRPINELFQIRDINDSANNYPYVAPNFNNELMQFYRFLQPPPTETSLLDTNSYTDKRTIWNSDIHLNCSYVFLSNDEARLFSANEQKYLFRQVKETPFYNVTGSNKINIESIGLVSNWMFYFQRSDSNLRNEWSNYTNWPYNYPPFELIDNGGTSTYKHTPSYNSENVKNILLTLGILLDGQYRENMQPAGVYNYIEKYTRTPSNAPDGLYCYNFCMNTSPYDLQPSGALNTNRFTLIEFEFNTTVPPLDNYAQTLQICDPTTGAIVGINKPTWRIYKYNYNLVLFEERINIITFIGGNAGLMYAT